MKKFIVLTLFMLSNQLNALQRCSCGSFENGIYEYNIVENTGGCCTGFPSGVNRENQAFLVTYEENEGVWEVVDVQGINPATAQSRCCQNNS